MTAQQMFVTFCCLSLVAQQITAVVNNPKSEESKIEQSDESSSSSSSTKVADSIVAASDKEADRRETPVLPLTDSYGAPLSGIGSDSYIPSAPSNPNLPIPVYGVPDSPSNNIIYPAPPPDLPPPPPQISINYGVPLTAYGPPKPIDNYGPPPPPPIKYGPPPGKYNNKPFIPPAFHKPRPHYGPPKPIFVPKGPKHNYGPPKPHYGPPKPLFIPQKHFKQPTVTVLTLPSKDSYAPSIQYGPPEPIPHGPPHPGAPAPPTPPDIKYDGWQPIPGLVSRPPSDSHHSHHSHHDLLINADFTPPPVGQNHGISSHSSSHGISDSYGAPLNAVTGSGGIDSSSGDSHHDDHSLSLGLSAVGINAGQDHLSVIKSIGYELFPNSGHVSLGGGDSYSSPPSNSYSSNGPYAAAHSYKSNGISSSFGSFGSSFKHGLSLSSSGIGLIPPSGVYGIPPSGHYGTPLISRPSPQYGAPLNALKINPPKHPVIFREPVPAGLIESVGHHTAHKDAHGIIENSHSSFSNGPAYIPPPVPDISYKPVKETPPEPSNLYSLPNPASTISFQDSSLSFGGGHAVSFGGGHAEALTSYTAPLGAVDGSYGLPLHSNGGIGISLDNAQPAGISVGLDLSHPPVTIDLTSATGQGSFSNGFGYHDCSLHKSQPLPSLSYGVPSANTYTESLSSLTTNIGGAYQGPSLTYGDLHTAHSQKVNSGVNDIESESHGKTYGKSIAETFGAGSELVKSESLDINNIPLQGALGSYTLQIQSADSLGGAPAAGQIPHAQVLNDGLLQSILAAIEQPQQKDATILGQPLIHLQPRTPGHESIDAETQQSVTNAVVVSPPVTEVSTSTTSSVTQEPLRLIDNNEIALYFRKSANDTKTESNVRNGQQYGNYVSFKAPSVSYLYENAKSDKEPSQD